MQTPPPFRLARSSTTPEAEIDSEAYMKPSGDACCAAPSVIQLCSRKRRSRLSELDSLLHCSIIGTCLSTSELRKLVSRFTLLDRHSSTDLEIHDAAVQLAIDGGSGCKALQKALDTRYAGALRTLSVRQAAFGEIHMLSHLVGAANRADIRHLVALEEENAALKEKVERQQSRLHEMGAQRDASICELNEQLAAVSAHSAAHRSKNQMNCKPRSLNCAKRSRSGMLARRSTRAGVKLRNNACSTGRTTPWR
jgi:hypothetical protein